jgi:molybdate-binding protein
MPNSRKEGKKNISAWIDEGDKAALQIVARERGIPLSDLLDELIKDKLNELKKKTKKVRK